MTILNPRGDTLQQLLPFVQARFPQATIRKLFLSPETIIVPADGYKFVVRRTKAGPLKVDHTLPVLYVFGAIFISALLVSLVLTLIYGQLVWGIGGALWIILGIVIMKAIFQSIKKKEFNQFKEDFTAAISGFEFEQKKVPNSLTGL